MSIKFAVAEFDPRITTAVVSPDGLKPLPIPIYDAVDVLVERKGFASLILKAMNDVSELCTKAERTPGADNVVLGLHLNAVRQSLQFEYFNLIKVIEDMEKI